MHPFNFSDLFIYDMANNHQGDLEHGLNIISAMGEVTRYTGVRGALKLQFLQLDTFIHSDYKTKKDVKHIPRFMETALNKNQYKTLTQAVRDNGMTTICTPFDEESVDIILELGIEIIKIASCSASDRPLLERIAQTNRPVIVSTAGLSMAKIDRLVSYFEAKKVHFALMHCIALYPTENDHLRLHQIRTLKERFPHITIGFSTHESPENYNAIRVAYAVGARIFERHVGLETEKHKLNAYSSKADQVKKWIEAWKETVDSCSGERRCPALPTEIASLRSLMRGVFAKEAINKGEALSRNKVFFAMPFHDGRLSSGDWREGLIADKEYKPNESISSVTAEFPPDRDEIIYRIMLQVRGMMSEARIFISEDSAIELSHHYGLERFREFGAVIIDCINRKYCKKLIIRLPRQKHPYHYHQKKEETFQLLHGDLEVELNGKTIKVLPGEKVLVMPGEWHKFHTLDGAIFEEVSTTHYNDDSYYEDERIALLPREARKTVIPNLSTLETKNV